MAERPETSYCRNPARGYRFIIFPIKLRGEEARYAHLIPSL